MIIMSNPAHPGAVLAEWLDGITITDAARKLKTTRSHLSNILNGHTGITAEMAIKLAKSLGTTPQLWMGMQLDYDLWQAQQKESPDVERLVA